MINNQLVERISALPPLPQTVTEIEKAYQNPHVDAKQIASIVEKDPMVVADLLKLLNSAYYGLRKEVTNIEHAVSMLGMRSVKDLVIDLSLRNMLRTNLSPYGIDSNTFAKISQFQSIFAQHVMASIDRQKVDRIRLTALLQEIGKIVIAEELLLEGDDATFQAELKAGWEIREVEQNYVSTTTAEVSAAMLKHWEFDSMIVDAVLFSDNPQQADNNLKIDAWVLRIASEAINVCDPLSQKSIKRAIKFAQKAAINIEMVQESLDGLAEKYQAS